MPTKVACSGGPESPFRIRFLRFHLELRPYVVHPETEGGESKSWRIGLKFKLRPYKGYSLSSRITQQNDDYIETIGPVAIRS